MRPKKKKKKSSEKKKRNAVRADPIRSKKIPFYSIQLILLNSEKKISVNLIEKFASQKRTKATFLC